MKTVNISILVAVGFLALFFISGCQESRETSDECRTAYEQNQKMYDYAGEVPEVCKD
ncbi:hypothetical protein [Limihaloglobus sulfuriphilus]|uniref:hypothetical protein n=1 Tax=Limihaloglobus sulfuriphilus TaxID=1851148 RepID=UPI001649E560|nr:hypothetical protein [Limihaloglobus sulfuriphilus]